MNDRDISHLTSNDSVSEPNMLKLSLQDQTKAGPITTINILDEEENDIAANNSKVSSQ